MSVGATVRDLPTTASNWIGDRRAKRADSQEAGATAPSIPASSEDITVEWLNQTVAPQFVGTIVDVQRETIGAGIGFIGDLTRCELSWAPAEQECANYPESVIVKIPAETNRGVGESLKAFDREIFVYRHLSDQIGLAMPAHIYSDLDPDPAPPIESVAMFLMDRLPLRAVNWLVLQFVALSGKTKRRFVLVMEDIADASPPSQVDGGSIEDALQALGALAEFHAKHWLSPVAQEAADAADVGGLIWPLSRASRVWQASYLRNRDEFLARFGDTLGASKIAKLDAVQENIPEHLERLANEPWTLLHGDYRLDNLLFRPDGELVILDYQLLAKGNPSWDVSYFITTALTADNLAEEERMLRRYHDRLVAAGRDDYAFDDLVTDHELAKLLLAHRCVCSLDSLQADLGGADGSLVDLMVTRIMAWVSE